jgi:hypothetical protein
MDWSIDDWTELGAAASVTAAGVSIVSAFVAIISLFFVYSQIKSQSKSAREVKAIEAWDAYLRLCVDRPELSSETTFESAFKRKPNTNYLDNDKDDERYLWFVSVMLNASEQVLLNSPSWRDWRHAIRAQVVYHETFLRSVWLDSDVEGAPAGWRSHYSKRVCDIVESVIGKNPSPWNARS